MKSNSEYKRPVLYICDLEKAKAMGCTGASCALGMCKCTSKKEWAKKGEKGKPIVALACDYYLR